MTIWSSQLRHNFFNHALFSCVKQEIGRIKGCILCMWHFVLAQTLQCLLWFSTESRSSDYPGLSPSALHPETQRNRMISWGALGKVPFWQVWKLEKMGKTWEAKNLQPNIFTYQTCTFRTLPAGTWSQSFPSSAACLEIVKKLKTASLSHPTCLVIPAFPDSMPNTYLTLLWLL